jgi:hypothetical protein
MALERVVICACGQWNRIKGQRGKRGWFSCGKCGRPLQVSANTTARPARWIGWGLLLFIVIGGVAGIYLAKTSSRQINAQTTQVLLPPSPAEDRKRLGREPDPSLSLYPSDPPTPQVPGPAPSSREVSTPTQSMPSAAPNSVSDSGKRVPPDREQVAQSQTPQLSPVPVKNGVLRQRKGESAIAGLRIETPSSADYILKLVNVRDGKEEMLIYVRRGSSFETKVPLGTYKITGAYGDRWYGEKHLFGPDGTSYVRLVQKDGKSDEFMFYRGGNRTKGYVVHGYDIHLTAQVSGNLETQNIREEEFRR